MKVNMVNDGISALCIILIILGGRRILGVGYLKTLTLIIYHKISIFEKEF